MLAATPMAVRSAARDRRPVAPNQGFLPRYDAGLYREGETRMLVSRGLGNSVIPVRINNRPELVVLQLRSGE